MAFSFHSSIRPTALGIAGVPLGPALLARGISVRFPDEFAPLAALLAPVERARNRQQMSLLDRIPSTHRSR